MTGDTLSAGQANRLTAIRTTLEALTTVIDDLLLADTEGKELDAEGNRLPTR